MACANEVATPIAALPAPKNTIRCFSIGTPLSLTALVNPLAMTAPVLMQTVRQRMVNYANWTVPLDVIVKAEEFFSITIQYFKAMIVTEILESGQQFLGVLT